MEYWDGDPPKPNQQGFADGCLKMLHALRGRPQAILVRNSAHAMGLATRRVAPLYDGIDGESAGAYVDRAQKLVGDARALSILLVEVLAGCGSGITANVRSQVGDACGATSINLGRKKKIQALSEELERIYADSTVVTFLKTLRSVTVRRDEINWQPLRWQTLHVLTDRRLHEGDDVAETLQHVIQMRKETTRCPRAFVSTIHRVKGREFDEVVIPYASASSFGNDDASRRLLYVALTRATKRLRILIPRTDPSPLFAR